MTMSTGQAVSITRGAPRSRTELAFEAIALRHQIAVLKRSGTRRPGFRLWDRLFWVFLSWWWPRWWQALMIVQPETVLRWRRDGWSTIWRYRSRGRWRGGRPKVSREVRGLIARMARENFLWGAPRIHGELLMLGFKVSQATVSRYLRTSDRSPGQSWRTFIRNQAVVFSHIQNLEQDSDSEPNLWDESGGVSEVARAELDAARGCWAARATCSVPVRRLGTAPGRRRNACNNLFPTQVPTRSPPYHVRASPRLPPLRKVFLRIKF
jgi:hypothetical protein